MSTDSDNLNRSSIQVVTKTKDEHDINPHCFKSVVSKLRANLFVLMSKDFLNTVMPINLCIDCDAICASMTGLNSYDRYCDSQSLKYLPSGPLQKEFANTFSSETFFHLTITESPSPQMKTFILTLLNVFLFL